MLAMDLKFQIMVSLLEIFWFSFYDLKTDFCLYKKKKPDAFSLGVAIMRHKIKDLLTKKVRNIKKINLLNSWS